MNKTVRRIALLLSLFVLLAFGVFVVGQTSQVVDLATRVNPTFGGVVLYGLLAAYALLLLVPVVLFLRLPPPLTPPPAEDGPEFARYMAGLKKRLTRNPNLPGVAPKTREEVDSALAQLNAKSDAIIKQSSSTLFLTTAISQSGRLDAFMVLAELSRMVWRIAHLYSQRPTLRDMTRLYGNVAGTAFVAAKLEDIDISEQMAPLVASVTGGLSGAIPGMQVGATIIAQSVMSGAANAFLALRVGIITRRYCGSLHVPTKGELRRAASVEAAKLLGGIVANGASQITKTTVGAARSSVGGAGRRVAGRAAAAGKSLLSRVGLSGEGGEGGEEESGSAEAPGGAQPSPE